MSLKQTNSAENHLVVGNIQILGKIGGGNVREIKNTVAAMANASALQAAKQTNYWSELAADTEITPVEKKMLKKEWDVIQSTYTSLIDLAESAGIAHTAPNLVAYKSSYQSLYTYLVNTLKLFDSMDSSTAVKDRESFNLLYQNYYDGEFSVQNLINGKQTEIISEKKSIFVNADNENVTIPVDASGSPLAGVLPMTIACSLYAGGKAVTSGASYAIESVSGVTIEPSVGVITIASGAALNDLTQIKVSCTYYENTYTAAIAIAKVYPGKNAELYELAPSVSFVHITSSGSVEPGTLTCTVYRSYGSDKSVINYGKIKYITALNTVETDYPAEGIAVTEETGWVKFVLYNPQGEKIDSETVPIVADGSSYVVSISGGAKIYSASSAGYVSQSVSETIVTVSSRTGDVGCQIGDLPHVPGFELNKRENKVLVKALAGYTMADAGIIHVPVTLYRPTDAAYVIGLGGDYILGLNADAAGSTIDTDYSVPFYITISYGKSRAGIDGMDGADGKDGKDGKNGMVRIIASLEVPGDYIGELVQCNNILYRWDGSQWIQIADIAPRYRGAVSTMPTVANIGDVVLFIGTETYSQGKLYRWDGQQWSLLNMSSSDNSGMIQQAMTDMFAFCAGLTVDQQPSYANQLTALTAIIQTLFVTTAFVDKLAANSAFIEKLNAAVITMKNGGCIKTENYDTTKDSGYKLDSSDGSASFNKLNVYGSLSFYAKLGGDYGYGKFRLPVGAPDLTGVSDTEKKGYVWIV